jgi:hypothetical protein
LRLDHNTIFFHKYANYYKNFNTIWEPNDMNGNKVQGFSRLVALGLDHFKKFDYLVTCWEI